MAPPSPKHKSPPELSAISETISAYDAKTERQTLALEVMHNLQYQHGWTDLKLHKMVGSVAPAPPTLDLSTDPPAFKPAGPRSVILVSGLPKRHAYVHPDFLAHLIKHDLSEPSVPVQREWVLPLSLGEKWSLRQFSSVFDALDERGALKGHENFEWKDGKRILLGMLANNGMGGDGTVAYYIMQEGEVKPRQNG